MRKEEFCDILGDISEKHIAEARAERKAKKTLWLKWGAVAACLCLVVGLAIPVLNNDTGNISERGDGVGGEGTAPGGTVLEGVDSLVASVAVFPAGESLLDVADATSVSISEAEARNVETLGDYLPDALPEGIRYGHIGYYETVMKDGTRYHMMIVTCESGEASAPAPAPEGAQASSEPMTGASAFRWTVWGHCPDTDLPIYHPDEVTAQLLEQIGGVFYINYGAVYVGVEKLDISTLDLLAVIDSMG